MIAPKTLNGYPVVSAVEHKNCMTVIVDRRQDFPDHDRYVVATWWPELGTSWSWGHYVDTMIQAGSKSSEVERRNATR